MLELAVECCCHKFCLLFGVALFRFHTIVVFFCCRKSCACGLASKQLYQNWLSIRTGFLHPTKGKTFISLLYYRNCLQKYNEMKIHCKSVYILSNSMYYYMSKIIVSCMLLGVFSHYWGPGRCRIQSVCQISH